MGTRDKYKIALNQEKERNGFRARPRQCFGTLSGWLKLSEAATIFISLILHRHGDNGNYLYFATTGLKLNYQDENIDVENLGNSTLVTFMVITLVLLVGYIIDGVDAIQDSILEPIWTLLGCLMFLASGIMVILTWSTEDYVSTSTSSAEIEYTRSSRAAMGLGALCIITSLIFLTDFIWVMCQRGKRQPLDDGA